MTERLTESELEDVLCCDGCAINMTAEQIKSMALELKELRKVQGDEIMKQIVFPSPPERNEP